VSASKQKGTAFETAVVRFMQAAGFDVERRALQGSLDKGDIAGLDGWVLECKAEKAITLAEYMKEAEQEAVNAGVPWYAAIVKRRNKNVSDAYVVLPLKVFIGFLKWWSMPVEAAIEEEEE
jgi:hypothetical protein